MGVTEALTSLSRVTVTDVVDDRDLVAVTLACVMEEDGDDECVIAFVASCESL